MGTEIKKVNLKIVLEEFAYNRILKVDVDDSGKIKLPKSLAGKKCYLVWMEEDK